MDFGGRRLLGTRSIANGTGNRPSPSCVEPVPCTSCQSTGFYVDCLPVYFPFPLPTKAAQWLENQPSSSNRQPKYPCVGPFLSPAANVFADLNGTVGTALAITFSPHGYCRRKRRCNFHFPNLLVRSSDHGRQIQICAWPTHHFLTFALTRRYSNEQEPEQ